MPNMPYKLLGMGKAAPDSITEARIAEVQGFAKKAHPEDFPFILANELICTKLAQAILLPTPPGFIVTHQREPWFVSLDCNTALKKLPPADVERAVAANPDVASGIIAFDVWMLNDDRHDCNLLYDAATNRLEVFDHSHALLRDGDVQQFRERINRVAVDLKNHCLAPEMTTTQYFLKWCDRISMIPGYYINEVVAAAVAVGLPKTFKEECAEALKARRKHIVRLIDENLHLMRNIQVDLTWEMQK